ncbi:M14 family zinc carboxypeptidase [candidate division CSSED10-310 bacterium]|uniref:M14 family zinc carboxypeptidase n=1 Tax=candidate division CSSED10-310 bacterium TaxID=2855610 RepID=A0ABV6YRD3_UNCC1
MTWSIMKTLLCITLVLFLPNVLWAYQEYQIQFDVRDKLELKFLTRMVSIDNVRGNTVWAVVNERQLEQLSRFGYDIKFIEADTTIQRGMATTIEQLVANWDLYPTYAVFGDLMIQLAADYPSLCHLQSIGTSVQNRELLFLKISDNVGLEENEPEVMLQSTMHGDETVGFILLLRLAHHMLSKYGDLDAEGLRITNIIDSVELWIMPDMNPDGTYYSGNHTVNGAIRSNGNGVDLNRNFPCPIYGDHPDGNAWQPETIAMMNFVGQHSFILSANYHGGVELLNLPWDCRAKLHPDNDWLMDFARRVVAQVHADSPAGYLDDVAYQSNPNPDCPPEPGITNGYGWYDVYGGRQDWVTNFNYGREITVELSQTKNPGSATLPDFWNYNKDALYIYIEESLKGIRGVVTDFSDNPLLATIDVIDRAEDPQEPVVTDPEVGDYHRLLMPGTYSLECSCPGYQPVRVDDVVVSAGDATIVNFMLVPQAVPSLSRISQIMLLISFSILFFSLAVSKEKNKKV